jgi:hypothetical protein
VKIRFQADENLNQAIVYGVSRREPSVDFQTPQEAGLLGATDQTLLQKCAFENRILVSHDIKTIPGRFAEFITRQTSAGVLLIPQRASVGEAIETLLMIWNSCDASEWENRICYLPH